MPLPCLPSPACLSYPPSHPPAPGAPRRPLFPWSRRRTCRPSSYAPQRSHRRRQGSGRLQPLLPTEPSIWSRFSWIIPPSQSFTQIGADRSFEFGHPLLGLGQDPVIGQLKVLDRPLGIEQGEKLRLARLVTDPCGLQCLLRLRQHGGFIERDHFLRRLNLRQEILHLEEDLVLQRLERRSDRVCIGRRLPDARLIFGFRPERKRETHSDHPAKAVPRSEILIAFHHHVEIRVQL